MAPSVTAYPRRSGAGKTWHHVLAALPAAGVDLMVARPRRWWPRPQAWLADGHRGALPVRRPVVAHMQEAPWAAGADQMYLHPDFARRMHRAGDEAAAQAAMVITPSEFSRQQVVATHNLHPDRVRVVSHGVDGTVFNPARRPDGLELISRAGLDRPYVAYVSSVHPRKNLPSLRTAVALLAERGFDHALVMVLSPAADRPDSSELQRVAGSELPGHPGRVAVLQGLAEPEVASVMAAAAVLCAPSFSEGFGLAPLEAMSCGTPIVVADRGALPEVAGEAGLIVAPEPEAIADGLALVLSDPLRRHQMVELGRKRAAELSWKNSAEGWAAVLREVTGR